MASKKHLIKIGCCGFRSSRESYYSALHSVEVQNTFYQPPQISTLEKWRKEAPPDFEFAVKAWQLITHQSASPTYKRLKRALTEKEKAESGSFRPTEIVREAWDVTRDCARALAARMVLIQCPASFKPLKQNIENLENFFGGLDRAGLKFCWEPRGDWPPTLVKDLCERLDLWHVVDPFAQATTTPKRCYFRLHGRKGWRYTYEDVELEELYSMLPKKAESYVFFNNISMKEDAIRFQELIGR